MPVLKRIFTMILLLSLTLPLFPQTMTKQDCLNQLETLQSQLIKAQTLLADSKQQLINSNQALADSNQQLVKSRSQVAILNQQIMQLEQQIAQLEQQIAQFKATLMEQQALSDQQLTQLASLKKASAILIGDINALQTKIILLNGQLKTATIVEITETTFLAAALTYIVLHLSGVVK